MIRSSKLITVLIATATLVGFAACSSDSNPATDNAVTDNATDTNTPDVVGDTTTDEGREVPGVDVQPEVGTDVQPEEGADVKEIPCVPNCEGRVCGADGCGEGGTCGTCAEGTTCAEADGQCLDNCDWATDKPTTWGPTGVISSLQTPSDKTVVGATCFDYTGEGTGDNGLKGLAGQVNGPLADAVSGGSIAILFELFGVTDFTNTASFQLNGLLGVSTQDPPATSGDFYVQEASYLTEICVPMISFKNAKITDGLLEAGPSIFQLSIPVQEGLVIDATLVNAKLKGTVANGDATTGFELTGGVLSGVLTKEQLVAAVAKLQATCDAAPTGQKPDFCSYLSVVNSAMALLFDLHQNRDADGNPDGTYSVKSKELPGDAASVCLTYGLSKAKVLGFEPAN